MPTRFESHRQSRVIASLLLVIGMALCWMSVTPTGALSCLNCFLAQRWVEATLSERDPRQSRPETQTNIFAHASTLPALDPPFLSESAVADPLQAIVSGDSSPSDAPSAIACQWVFRTRAVLTPPTLDAGPSQSAAGLDPTILGFRAPPSLIAA